MPVLTGPTRGAGCTGPPGLVPLVRRPVLSQADGRLHLPPQHRATPMAAAVGVVPLRSDDWRYWLEETTRLSALVNDRRLSVAVWMLRYELLRAGVEIQPEPNVRGDRPGDDPERLGVPPVAPDRVPMEPEVDAQF